MKKPKKQKTKKLAISEVLEFVLEVADYCKKERADRYVGLPDMVEQWEYICDESKRLAREVRR